MKTVTTKDEVRAAVAAARAEGSTIGLVPTMGALHEGHISLVRASAAECGFTVVSVFVNPTQFGPGEDLEQYPRDLEGDAAKAEEAGAQLIFAPAADEMYPSACATTVHVAALTQGLCGAYRPGHFDGVTTVVCKLLNIVQPDRAYFGQKDYQQLVVIARMVYDLDMPVTVVPCATVREADGLALSSRNRYLGPRERAAAPTLRAALERGAEAARAGGTGQQVEQAVAAVLGREPLFRVQYIAAVDPETLEPLEHRSGAMQIAVAAFLGETRLIDNIRVDSG